MLKKIALVLTIIFVTACNQGGSGTPTPTPAPSKVVLIWWNMFEPKENVQPLIDLYESQHTNVEIQYEQKGTSTGITGYKAELDAVITDKEPNNNPDIFTIHNTWAPKYEAFITKAPATLVPADDLNDFYPIIKQNFATNGIVALPINMDSIALIYNKDKLQEAGYTSLEDDWTKFETQAHNLTKKDSSNKIVSAGFSAGFPDNTEFMFDLFSLLQLQNGVAMTDANATTATFATGGELTKSQGAQTFYNKFTSNATWSETMKKDIAAFLEKKLAVYAAPSWRLIDILNYNKQYNLNLNVGVAPVPQLGDGHIYWATYWGQTVSKESKNSAVAWDFIKFLTQKEQLTLLDATVKTNGRPFGILYPRQSMAKLITDDTTINPLLGPYIQSFANAQTWNMVDGFNVKGEFDRISKEGLDLKKYETAVTTILKEKGNPP